MTTIANSDSPHRNRTDTTKRSALKHLQTRTTRPLVYRRHLSSHLGRSTPGSAPLSI